MSKSELAKFLDVSCRTVRNWQNDLTEMPVSKLLMLSEKWKCSLDYLLGLTDVREIATASDSA